MHVHHGRQFTENLEEYVGGEVGVVDNCHPDEWFKVEIEAICREFGYTAVSRLWYINLRDNEENRVFHLIKDDKDAMLMTELVRGHGQIHVYVEHPVYYPILINGGNGVTLEVAVGNEHDEHDKRDEHVGFMDVSDFEGELAYDAYYNGKDYFDDFDEDGSSGGDDDFNGHQYVYEGDMDDDFGRDDRGDRDGGVVGSEGGYDGGENPAPNNGYGVQTNSDVEIIECRRPGKEPVVGEPEEDGAINSDNNDDSNMEGPREMNPNQRFVGADSDDNWENEVEAPAPMPDQMGAGVMNSDYTNEELLSLTESSDNGGVDDSGSKGHGEGDHGQVDNVIRRNKFPVLKPVFNPEHLRFVKNDKLRDRAKCQPLCKFTAYLAKMSKEMTYQLKTLNLEYTCTRSYKNPRFPAKFLAKKLMKKVRRQPDIRLKDIQDAIHEKYVVHINAGKASRAKERAQEDLFWREAKATYAQEFERLMNEIKDVDEGAYLWLKGHTTTIWARHMFRSDGLTDIVLNNMCESFNSRIIKFRGKPIISMLEDIKLYLMNRSQQNRLSILKVESELCPKVCKRLHREKLGSSRWLAFWASDTRFEVKNELTSNNGHGGRASGVAINEPASTHPTRSSTTTTILVTSSTPSDRPANNSAATSYAATSSAPPNTSTSKRRKGSITSDTLNASRNASRYREVLSANGSQASVHGPRGSANGI
nr:hypothetical protein CFP56_34353 [Quercus suber]